LTATICRIASGREIDYLHTFVSLNYEAFTGGTIHLNWQRAQRAPDVQELLTSGPHFTTRSFELGRIDLNREQADHFEFSFHLARKGFSLLANGYYKRIDNFIYLQSQGLFFNFSLEPPRFQLSCANLQNCLPE
jgi:iron complex outermembrane recepter protein